MCGYDPFRWADNFESEEEYNIELMKVERELENDEKRINADSGRAKKKEY